MNNCDSVRLTNMSKWILLTIIDGIDLFMCMFEWNHTRRDSLYINTPVLYLPDHVFAVCRSAPK